jgi:hypothetical protein
MTRRQPNFLSSYQWKTIPWSLNPSSKSLLHHLLDEVANLPGILHAYDSLEEQLNQKLISPGQRDSGWLHLLPRLESLGLHLEDWKTEWAESADKNSGFKYEVPVVDRGKASWMEISPFGFQLPPFPENPSCDGVHPKTVIYYSDGFLAHSLNLYYASMILLTRLGAQMHHISSLEKILAVQEFGRLICRSMEYQIFFTPPGVGALWSLFPLRQAFGAFPESSSEWTWMEGLLKWMDGKSPFTVTRLVRPELDMVDMDQIEGKPPAFGSRC